MEFSKQDYLKDAKIILANYGANLWRVMPNDFNHYFENLDLDIACGNDPLADSEMTKLDEYFNTPFFRWLDYCYEYGVNGIQVSRQDPGLEEDEDYIPFLNSLIEAYDFISNNIDGSYGIRFDRIRYVQEKTRARTVMDNPSISELPGKIYLTELAILADLDEKTIRNIASKKPEGFPAIHKSGTRSLVDKEEARAWLLKRGWKATVKISDSIDWYQLTSGFKSLSELQSFMEKALEEPSIEQDKRTTIQKWLKEFSQTLHIELDAIRWISAAGNCSPQLLLKSVFELKQKLELEQLNQLLLTPS